MCTLEIRKSLTSFSLRAIPTRVIAQLFYMSNTHCGKVHTPHICLAKTFFTEVGCGFEPKVLVIRGWHGTAVPPSQLFHKGSKIFAKIDDVDFEHKSYE